jgi:hypothetical protein
MYDLLKFCLFATLLLVCFRSAAGAKSYNDTRGWLYKYPEASHELLQLITGYFLFSFLFFSFLFFSSFSSYQVFRCLDAIVDYLIGQVKAGAQAGAFFLCLLFLLLVCPYHCHLLLGVGVV